LKLVACRVERRAHVEEKEGTQSREEGTQRRRRAHIVERRVHAEEKEGMQRRRRGG
jgi:hypothetical protein